MLSCSLASSEGTVPLSAPIGLPAVGKQDVLPCKGIFLISLCSQLGFPKLAFVCVFEK